LDSAASGNRERNQPKSFRASSFFEFFGSLFSFESIKDVWRVLGIRLTFMNGVILVFRNFRLVLNSLKSEMAGAGELGILTFHSSIRLLHSDLILVTNRDTEVSDNFIDNSTSDLFTRWALLSFASVRCFKFGVVRLIYLGGSKGTSLILDTLPVFLFFVEN
jgi:hypothetical protein